MSKSALEALYAAQLAAVGLPEPVRELRFCDGKQWRFDFAWPDHGMLVAEIDGGQWVNGRHNRGAGMERDYRKYNAALLLGWRVLHFCTSMVEDGSALETTLRAFGRGG